MLETHPTKVVESSWENVIKSVDEVRAQTLSGVKLVYLVWEMLYTVAILQITKFRQITNAYLNHASNLLRAVRFLSFHRMHVHIEPDMV
jgi:hypothetical protein